MNIIKSIKRVFDDEIVALSNTRDNIDPNIEEVINKLISLKGKLILTGIGKPGHIANKSVATFSSLGLPSFFLHPSEALHGDLGALSDTDIVFAYSYSGQSYEVIEAVKAMKIKGIFVVVFTSNENSLLAKLSDLLIKYPKVEEACHLNLAPTSSTTMSLVYNDAIAVTYSELIRYSSDDFGINHPAGKLGRRLTMKVKDIMIQDEQLPIIDYEGNITSMLIEISSKSYGIVNVLRAGKLVGVITDGDIRRELLRNENINLITKARRLMTETPFTINQETLLVDAVSMLNKKNIYSAPVLDERGLVGVINLKMITESGII